MKRIAFTLIAVLGLMHAGLAAEGNWLTDFAKAQTTAKQENKMVFMDFTGSDWCPPCITLHKKVLTTKEFLDYAKDNLVLVVVDFPRRTKLPESQQKANETLATKYKIQGFPTVIVLDKDGKELSKDVGYSGESAQDFIAKLKDLKKKA